MSRCKELDTSESRATTSTKPQSAKRKKSCQVPGCTAVLATQDKPSYCIKRRLCHEHIRADAVQRVGYPDNQLWRYCFQCGKLELLSSFDGDKRNCRTSLHNRREAASRSKSLKSGTSKERKQKQQQHKQQQAEEEAASICTDLLQEYPKAGLQSRWQPATSSGLVLTPGLVPCSSSILRHASTAGTCITPAIPPQVDVAFNAAAAAAELAHMFCTSEDVNDLGGCDQVSQAMMAELQFWQQQQQQQQRPPSTNWAARPAVGLGLGDLSSAATTAAATGCPAASSAAAGCQWHDMLLVDSKAPTSASSAAGHEDCYRQLLDHLLADLAATAVPSSAAVLPQHVPAGQQLPGTRVMPLPGPPAAAVDYGAREVMGRIAQLELQCAQLSIMLRGLQSMQ